MPHFPLGCRSKECERRIRVHFRVCLQSTYSDTSDNAYPTLRMHHVFFQLLAIPVNAHFAFPNFRFLIQYSLYESFQRGHFISVGHRTNNSNDLATITDL